MSIKERFRRMPADAVDTAQPAHAPVEKAHRRHRRRRRLAAIVALVLVLATAALLTVTLAGHPKPAGQSTVVASSGWKEFREPSRNLRFSYPRDWVVRPHPKITELLVAVPPEYATASLNGALPFGLGIQVSRGYYIGKVQAELSEGRLPGGQSYVQSTEPATIVSPPEVKPPVQLWYDTYYVDWGRHCSTVRDAPQPTCDVYSVTATIVAGSSTLWDRYRPVAVAMVQTLAQVRTTRPSYGDRSRPPCQPGQWRLVPEHGWSYIPTSRSWLIQGTVLPRGTGPPCHLRVVLRVAVERSGGKPPAVLGTQAAVAIEGDLPEDTRGITPDDSLAPATPLTWHWTWRNWCTRSLVGIRVRITGPAGQSAIKQPPPLQHYLDQGENPCEGVSPGAPWKIAPWP